MSDSILNTIKKLLGLSTNDTSFDTDIIAHINTVLVILYQIGVGTTPFKITGSTETWNSVVSNEAQLEMVKSYMYMKVRKAFDPPASSSAMTALDQLISELEFRINVAVDPKKAV